METSKLQGSCAIYVYICSTSAPTYISRLLGVFNPDLMITRKGGGEKRAHTVTQKKKGLADCGKKKKKKGR